MEVRRSSFFRPRPQTHRFFFRHHPRIRRSHSLHRSRASATPRTSPTKMVNCPCALAQNKAVGAVSLQVAEADAQLRPQRTSREGWAATSSSVPAAVGAPNAGPRNVSARYARKFDAEIGLPCVINYGPGEESLVAEVQSASGDARPVSYDGRTGTHSWRCFRCALHRRRRYRTSTSRRRSRHSGRRAVRPHRSRPQWSLPAGRKSSCAAPPRSPPTAVSNVADPSLLDLSVEQVFNAVRQSLGTHA